MDIIKVGIAELKVTRSPNSLRTVGLGSCVGVTLYDCSTNIAGMAHVMLPQSPNELNEPHVAKYADTAIPELLREMISIGAKKNFIEAKLAGGAQMFNFSRSNMLKIGMRNTIECKKVLGKLGIPIVAEDVGGDSGRTIEIYSSTGVVRVKQANLVVKEI